MAGADAAWQLPFLAALLATVLIPTRGAARRYCARFVRAVSDYHDVFCGCDMSVLGFTLLLNIFMLLSSGYGAYQRGQEYQAAKAAGSGNISDLLGKKWRAERNFWMATSGTVLALFVPAGRILPRRRGPARTVCCIGCERSTPCLTS